MAVSINDFDKAVVYGLTNINDPTTRKPILVDSQGRVILAGGGTGGATVVEGITGGVPVPVSNASLPLPTGAATGAKQDTGNTSLGAIATNTTNAGAPVLAAGENHVGAVGGATVEATGTFTRPNDSNAYAANDAVTTATSGALPCTVANAARVAAGSGVIMSARVVKSTNAAAASGLRLWLYNTVPGSAIADNAAFTIASAAKATRLGYIDLTTVVVGSDCVEFTGNSGSFSNGVPFKLPSGRDIGAIIQTLGAFTPAALEVLDIYLNILQD